MKTRLAVTASIASLLAAIAAPAMADATSGSKAQGSSGATSSSSSSPASGSSSYKAGEKPDMQSSGSSGTASSGASSGASGDKVAVANELSAAADRLREAIQAMAKAPPGPGRAEAIRDSHEALIEVQQARVALPAEMYQSSGSSGSQQKAMTKLEAAADRIRDSAQALALQQPGPKRNEAIKNLDRALLDAQTAMLEVPATVSKK